MATFATRAPRARLLYALYSLAGVALLLGLLFGKRDERGVNRIPKPTRMLSSALVLLCALLQRRAGAGQLDLVAAGMGAGFLGDLVMAEIIPLPEHVLFGMLTFGLGHGCYIGAVSARGRAAGLNDARAGRAALGASWLVALLGWLAMVRSPRVSAALNYGALAYALLLASMAGAAAALAAQDRRYMPVAAGGGLFLLSDLILASRLFRGAHFEQIGDVVWLTYIAGQALIVDGMGRA
jgi:uncharacterized membrane protein YuzA (DUF378 family)